jgi:hypothetical protein
MQYSKLHWDISSKTVYSNIHWNEKKINEYYNYAKRCVSSEEKHNQNPWKNISSCNIKKANLSEYKKNPPKYNECLVSSVFFEKKQLLPIRSF